MLAAPQISYLSDEDNDSRVILGVTSADPPRRLKVVVREADPDFVITVADRDNEE